MIQPNMLFTRKINIGMSCYREAVGFLLLKIFGKRLESYWSWVI